MKDYLDERIEADSAADPEFAAQWNELQSSKTLSRLRKDRHLTQAAVAEKMGLTQSRVAEIERHPGRVAFARIVLYAKAVGVSTDDVAAAILLAD